MIDNLTKSARNWFYTIVSLSILALSLSQDSEKELEHLQFAELLLYLHKEEFSKDPLVNTAINRIANTKSFDKLLMFESITIRIDSDAVFVETGEMTEVPYEVTDTEWRWKKELQLNRKEIHNTFFSIYSAQNMVRTDSLSLKSFRMDSLYSGLQESRSFYYQHPSFEQMFDSINTSDKLPTSRENFHLVLEYTTGQDEGRALVHVYAPDSSGSKSYDKSYLIETYSLPLQTNLIETTIWNWINSEVYNRTTWAYGQNEERFDNQLLAELQRSDIWFQIYDKSLVEAIQINNKAIHDLSGKVTVLGFVLDRKMAYAIFPIVVLLLDLLLLVNLRTLKNAWYAKSTREKYEYFVPFVLLQGTGNGLLLSVALLCVFPALAMLLSLQGAENSGVVRKYYLAPVAYHLMLSVYICIEAYRNCSKVKHGERLSL